MSDYLTKSNKRIEDAISLPSIEYMQLKRGVDRFGFSSFLFNRLKIKLPYRTFVDWDQGWNYGDPNIWIKEDFITGNTGVNEQYVASRQECKKLLEGLGYKKIIMGGLPFCYIDTPNVEKIKNSALFILPKYLTTSSHNGRVNHSKSRDKAYDKDRLNFVKYVNSVKGDFNKSVLCIFPENRESEELIELCAKFNIEVVLGASPYDKNALTRMAILFSKFEYCISNGLGSHIVYSNIMGGKACVVEPFIELHNSSRSVNWNNGFSEKYCRDEYPWLFVTNHRLATNKKKWAMKVAGCNYKLKKNTIIKVLSWSIPGQLKMFFAKLLKHLSFD